MKKISGILLMAGMAAIMITGCKGKGSNVANDPKAVLSAFFERMSKKDLEGAAKLATKDSKSTIDMMKKAIEASEKMKGMKGMEEKDPVEEFKAMTFGDAKIDGDNATVAVTNTAKGNEAMEFPLKKEDGSWKVDFSMGTLMKMGMNKMNNGEMPSTNTDDTSGANSMEGLDKLINSDTLKESLEKAQDMLKNIKPEDLEKAKDALKDLEKLKQN